MPRIYSQKVRFLIESEKIVILDFKKSFICVSSIWLIIEKSVVLLKNCEPIETNIEPILIII